MSWVLQRRGGVAVSKNPKKCVRWSSATCVAQEVSGIIRPAPLTGIPAPGPLLERQVGNQRRARLVQLWVRGRSPGCGSGRSHREKKSGKDRHYCDHRPALHARGMWLGSTYITRSSVQSHRGSASGQVALPVSRVDVPLALLSQSPLDVQGRHVALAPRGRETPEGSLGREQLAGCWSQR